MLAKQVISEVVEIQAELHQKKKTGTPRSALEDLKLYDSFVLIICGIRRCGKSTLLNQALKSKFTQPVFLNFEDPRLAAFELSDFLRFDEIVKEIEPDVIAFDEIQNVPQWEKYIRSKQDQGQKIIVTGSNASMLSKEFGTLLTGRYIIKELFPFSYEEYLNFTSESAGVQSFSKYLNAGGFPEYLKTNDPEILNRLIDDILLRDITLRFGVRQHFMLRQLTLYLVSNIGKCLSLNQLKNLFSVGSVNSISNYIEWLEDSYLIFSIPKFSFSVKKQIYNPRKIYCVDTGLAGANSLSMSKDQGRKLENLVFLHFRRNRKTIFYYAEKNECDFIIVEKGQPLEAVQVCLQLTSDNLDRELKGLVEAMTELNLESGLIITFDQEDSFEVNGKVVKAIPAWKYLTI
ncbi:MAG: ATP-binding protein [Prolixibacteraceae bacterium]|nr:ATP-binding protein [Prolixibacteraceae bacterium]